MNGIQSFAESLCRKFHGLNTKLSCSVLHQRGESMEDERSCKTCKWYLGGGCCKLNVEDECEAGGGFEAWTEK